MKPNTKTFIDLTAKVYGRLTVLEYAGKPKNVSLWKCRCECGNIRSVPIASLRSGRIKSCGCYAQTRTTTHGRSKTNSYKAWKSMKDRCLRKSSVAFPDYGGRGITICDKWMTFEGFYSDMGDPPDGFTIERIDNNSGYEKTNCRWADRTDQARNRRNSRFITINGQQVHAKDAADILGVQYKTLMARINVYKWTDEDLVRGYKKHNARKAR